MRGLSQLQVRTAVTRIDARGALLVYPVNNRPEPPSLWTEFFPNTVMVWDWNEDGDTRVARLWQLMKELSDCGRVVYSKWYQGRATFFSRELFTAMLAVRGTHRDPRRSVSREAWPILEILENNSPLSTRELKRAADLQGRENERVYTAAMKELFTGLLIVGYGEVEDGAFPSASVGATELLFSDLWRDALDLPLKDAQATIDRLLPQGTLFRRFFDRSSTPRHQ